MSTNKNNLGKKQPVFIRLRECFPNLPFPHENKRKNGHITNAKQTNICQVGFSTDTRTDPFFVVAENSVTESVYFGEPV